MKIRDKIRAVILKLGLKNIIIYSSISAAVILLAVLCLLLFGRPPHEETPAPSAASSDSSVSQEAAEPIPEKLLQITNVEGDTVNTTDSRFTFIGTADPLAELTLNGSAVTLDQNGNFSVEVELNVGKNSFEFTHKAISYTYTVNYRYILIESYSPSSKQTLAGGSVIVVNVNARNGSRVFASFNGQTIQLSLGALPEGGNQSDSFSPYEGSFTLPSGGTADANLGKITFSAEYNGLSEKFYSGNIILKKSSLILSSDPAATPSGGNYIDVGSGLIATVIAERAETFNGNTTDDKSRPTNNYLPAGTVDYCAEGTVTNGNKTYAKLRCGRRVYTDSNAGYSYSHKVITTSIGTLPDHNEITVFPTEQTEDYTLMKFGCLFKAPFYLDILPQQYHASGNHSFNISAVTYSYVDITFCYATVFEGELFLPEDNPIFSSAQIIANESDYTLRLFLKKTGGFYGWDAFYDADGKLVFKFLNPHKMENNDSLAGAKIYIDVGHGGIDSGAVGFDRQNSEAARNLVLANKIKARLEALGATVIMNRTDNSAYISPPDRTKLLRQADADFCLAIHHDSNSTSSLNGFGAYHFTPFSKAAADYIDLRTDNTGIYRTNWSVRSHYYYVARVSNCPVVLTENGYISNLADYNNIVNDGVNDIKAAAIADGILDYFRSIQ